MSEEGRAQPTGRKTVKWSVVERLQTKEEARMVDKLPRASRGTNRALRNRDGRYARFDN